MDPELKISRVFDAPRALVFKAWSKPELVSQWFAPKPLTVPDCDIDFRDGGAWNLTMRFPDGATHPMKALYREIKDGTLIVFSAFLEDEPQGHEIHTTVRFSDEGSKTRVDVLQVYRGMTLREGSKEGWASTLDNLAEFLKR